MANKISVIIPCYNQAAFLEETLLSVFNQTHPDWECLIINDGSTDNTDEIAQIWTLKDKRFQYFYKENGGLSSARNFGLEKISGDYIQFLDSDDIIFETKFENSISIFQQEISDLVISNFNCFYTNKTEIIRPYCQLENIDFNLCNILNYWDVKFTIPIHCGLFTKEILKDFTFDTELKAKEDWLLWIFVFNKNPKFSFINRPFAFYRLHEKSMTQDDFLMNKNFEKVFLKIKNYISLTDFENFLIFRMHEYKNENKILKNKLSDFEILKFNLNSEKFIINLFFEKFFNYVPFKKIGFK